LIFNLQAAPMKYKSQCYLCQQMRSWQASMPSLCLILAYLILDRGQKHWCALYYPVPEAKRDMVFETVGKKEKFEILKNISDHYLDSDGWVWYLYSVNCIGDVVMDGVTQTQADNKCVRKEVENQKGTTWSEKWRK